MLTYKKIITLLRYFADNHGQIKSTGYGQISSIAQTQNIQYPLMFISPSSSSIEDQVLDLEFNVLIMDRLQDSLDNEVEIHSDMLSIASDLRVWLNTDASDYFSVIESSNVQFFSERFGDYLGGVNLKIKINAEWDWNSCTIPGLELNWNENGDIIQPNYFYFNFLPLSGGTLTGCIDAPCYLSGGTPLETIIYNIASVYSGGSTTGINVQPGVNTYTGGTPTNPTVNVSALTINTLIASGNSIFTGTLSGGSSFSANTLFSGTTNLNTYFGQLQASAITNANNISQNSNILATKANISGQTFTGNIVVPTITASTIFSGTTNLVNLLSQDISANRIKGSTANRYHTSTNIGFAFSNQTVTNGRLVFCPFLVGEQITIDRIGVSLAASSTTESNVIRLGIYNCDANHIPSTLLLDAGTVTASATTNLITISISQQLNPGLYYLAMLADYTVASAIRGIPTTAFQNPLGWTSNPTLGITGYYYNNVGYGALPSSAGSLTTSTSAIPAIFVRIA